MAHRSRRRAREAALRALYSIEVGHVPYETAIQEITANSELPADLQPYFESLVRGVRRDMAQMDESLAGLIHDYEYDRLATVDRTVLRLAAYELVNEPAIAPAITINEAVEIAKKYSTAESGKFVNGVLGAFLGLTDKANWDPDTAPEEVFETREPEDEIEVEEIDLDPESEEGKKIARIGGWKLRSALDPS